MGLKILVVDDDAGQLALLRIILGREGHSVTVAESKEAAVKNIEKHNYDLVISDCNLPSRDEGVQFLQHVTHYSLKNKRPIPAKILASGDHDGLARKALSAGATPLYKTYKKQDLNAAIGKAIVARDQLNPMPPPTVGD